MEKINELFENELNGIIHAYPSIYTKDDVSELLSKLRTAVLYEASELKPTVGITEMKFQEFAADISRNLERSLCNGQVEVYDTGSAEFSIGYDNKIQIENIDVLTDNITDELHDILLDQFQVHFGKFIVDESSDNS
jgi:hypothetical protein